MHPFITDIKSDKTFFFYRGGVALYALLKSMQVAQNDQVILPSFTCPAVPYPIMRLGAKPVYVDIDPITFNIDPGKIEAKITRQTKAIIVQHTFGVPAEMTPILDIARRHNLWIIEDSCHAFGSRYRGQQVSTFGDAAIYSFGWYKPVVLGVGGAAVVNNPRLKTKMGEIYAHFTTPSLKELLALYPQYLVYNLLVKPSRFWFMKKVYRRLTILGVIAGSSRRKKKTNTRAKKITPDTEITGKKIIPFQKRRLFSKLNRWDDAIARQKWIVSRCKELLLQIGYAPVELAAHLEPVYYKYPLLFERKKEIFAQAQQTQVEMSDMFGSPLYPPARRANWKALAYKKGMCPIAEDVSARIVALPIHAKIQAKDIEKTIALLAYYV